MTERGSEMSDLASSAPAISDPDVGDPTAVIDDELLITEVKKHPPLYNKAYAEYIEKEARIKNWNNVCQSLFKQWSEFNPKKKKEKIRIVQNKWQKQTDSFFKSYNGVQKHPASKKCKKTIDSMTFLVPSTVASDVDVGTCASHTNTDKDHAHIADETPMDTPLLPETPQVNIPYKPAVPSTSEHVGEFARAYEVKKQPYYIPMPEIGLPPTIDPNPNMHFAHMLVPLLNRLSQKQLYSAWSQILSIIQITEGEGRFGILQQELIYPSAVDTQEKVQEEAAEENPIYPSHYGRPTNPEGEIMYPETDHEDLDDV